MKLLFKTSTAKADNFAFDWVIRKLEVAEERKYKSKQIPKAKKCNNTILIIHINNNA